MEYRHLNKMRGTKKLLWNSNISLFQPLMDCLVYDNMKSCNKQWNTLPQLWNLFILIFHSSMEFHGTCQKFHGIPWNFSRSKGSSIEFHGTLKVPWNLMLTPNSMEFHVIARPRKKFHGITWNFKSSMEFGYITKFHVIPLPSWEVPWNSMKLRKFHGTWSDTKFHGTLVPPNGLSPSSIEFHGILWNSGAAKLNITQFHGIPFQMGGISKGRHLKCSMEFHGIFDGTLQSPNKKSPNSMGFHGIRRAPFQMTQVFHRIPWYIPWNSLEPWCRQMTYHLVPWNSMKLWDCLLFNTMLTWTCMVYFMEFHGTLESPNKKSPSSIPWN